MPTSTRLVASTTVTVPNGVNSSDCRLAHPTHGGVECETAFLVGATVTMVIPDSRMISFDLFSIVLKASICDKGAQYWRTKNCPSTRMRSIQ